MMEVWKAMKVSENMKIRTLRANEIECRVQSISVKDGLPTGAIILLYKDARCDQKILDETFGPMNWQRKHTRDNANCIVSIWDDDKKQWIEKEDTGTESNTEKEKGLASDSFKRACFNWGIGRELYSSPFIFVKASDMNITQRGNGFTTYDRFSVLDIDYNDEREINYLTIKNSKTNKMVYQFGNKQSKPNPITKGTIKQIDILAKQFAELSQTTLDDVMNVLSEKHQFAKIESLTDEIGQAICKQLNNWIILQQKKNKENAKAQ